MKILFGLILCCIFNVGSPAKLKTEVKRLKAQMAVVMEALDYLGTGFTACVVKNQIYNSGEKIVFPKVFFNRGNHYNPVTSTFTCPVDGVYQFELHVLNWKPRPMRARIMKSNWPLGRAETWSANKEEYTQGSNSILVNCKKHERVWAISSPASSGDGINGNNPATHPDRCISSFSGKLLAAFPKD